MDRTRFPPSHSLPLKFPHLAFFPNSLPVWDWCWPRFMNFLVRALKWWLLCFGLDRTASSRNDNLLFNTPFRETTKYSLCSWRRFSLNAVPWAHEWFISPGAEDENLGRAVELKQRCWWQGNSEEWLTIGAYGSYRYTSLLPNSDAGCTHHTYNRCAVHICLLICMHTFLPITFSVYGEVLEINSTFTKGSSPCVDF